MTLGRPLATLTLVLVALLVASGAACGTETAAATSVTTPNGTLQGSDDGTTREFLGIRYAQAPVGPLRWAPPVPSGPWNGTVPATAPGPECPQPGGDARQNEDCLFLNVTTPSTVAPGERLPVMVWWHGGGFSTGSGADYDARRLADEGHLAVVTVNYRLGTLGYLGLPGLPGSGAFGFADQLQSLRWVRTNVAAFGGDPDNVTVAGQSAGAASTCALLTSPALAQLAVKRVIVMSGACSTRFPANGLVLGAPARAFYTSTPTVEGDGVAAATSVGCPPPGQLECLRTRPVGQLLRLTTRFTSLAYGNDLLPDDPSTALASVGPTVPVLYGGTRDEARTFFARTAAQDPQAFSPPAYARLLADGFGAAAPRVDAQYPVARDGGSGGLTWSSIITDAAWACPTLRDQQTLATRTPTYAYEYAAPDGAVGEAGFPTGGAGHASDLRFLFDLRGQQNGSSDQDLARTMVAYWSSFVRDGRPQAAGAPSWDPVPSGGPIRPLQLDPTGVRPVDTGAEHQCTFWSTVG